MGKAKKAKNAKLSQDRLNAKARNAAGAAATAGRARTFADKGDILAKNKGDAEIEEGLEEYINKHRYTPAAKNKLLEQELDSIVRAVFEGLKEFYWQLADSSFRVKIARQIDWDKMPEHTYGATKDQIEALIKADPSYGFASKEDMVDSAEEFPEQAKGLELGTEETPIGNLLIAAKQALRHIDDNHNWTNGYNGKAEGVTSAGIMRYALATAIKQYEASIK